MTRSSAIIAGVALALLIARPTLASNTGRSGRIILKPDSRYTLKTCVETPGPFKLQIAYRSAHDCTVRVDLDGKPAFLEDGLFRLPASAHRTILRELRGRGPFKIDKGSHEVTLTPTGVQSIEIASFGIVADANLPTEQLADPRSDVKTFGLFEDSLVDEITPWSVVERNDRIPEYVLPAYIGSGLLGVGIDGSGMQVLDCPLGRSARYHQGEVSHTDDLYILGEGTVSDHIEPKNLMPLGYFTYALSVDGVDLSSPAELVSHSSDWSRQVDIKRATVITGFTIARALRMTITGFAPQGSNRILFRVDFKSLDGRPHDVTFAPSIHTRMRPERPGSTFGGQSIFDRVIKSDPARRYAYLEGEVDHDGKYKPQGTYRIGYAITADAADRYFAAEDGIGFTRKLCVSDEEGLVIDASVIRLKSSTPEPDAKGFGKRADEFGEYVEWLREQAKSDGPEFAVQSRNAYDATRRAHIRDWKRFYETTGQVSVGDPVREMVFNNSRYLFRIGGTYNNGLPICFLLYHPWCWHAATFWDLNFTMDAMVRTNNLDAVRKGVSWLNAVKTGDGRTFPWVMLYDGTSAMQSDWKDTGYHVNAAHAMSAIRLYETTHDRKLLAEVSYPIVRSVARYATAERFIKDGGKYIGAGAAGDINGPEVVNELYSAAWFGVVLKKATQYAKVLGTDAGDVAKWTEVLDHLQLAGDAKLYHCFRDAGMPGGWVSMLLYPTECMPLLDMDRFRRTRDVSSFAKDYYDAGFSQPWCYFWQASSDLRTGVRKETADALITQGLRYTYGPGYLSEITPDSKGLAGLPPIETAHAAYITAIAEQLLMGSIWDNTIRAFTDMPERMESQRISFERLRTPNGVLVTGSYSPDIVKLELTGVGAYSLHAAVPLDKRTGGAKVYVDGEETHASVSHAEAHVQVELAKGKAAHVEIR